MYSYGYGEYKQRFLADIKDESKRELTAQKLQNETMIRTIENRQMKNTEENKRLEKEKRALVRVNQRLKELI